MATIIDNELYKEELCKNDDCQRVLFLCRKKNLLPGIVIRIECPRCHTESIFRFGYSEMEEQFDKIKSMVKEGGEN